MKKSISIGSMEELNVMLLLNVLLTLAALVVLALLVREVMVGGAVPARRAGMGAAGAAAAQPRGGVLQRRAGFAEYAVIGRSGLLGVKTTLTQLRTGPLQGRGGAGAPAATADAAGAALLGTVLGAGGNDFAVFREKTSGREEVVRRGDMVFSIGKLVSVEKYSATVESGGRKLVFNMDLAKDERSMVQGPPERGPGLGMLRGPGAIIGPNGASGGINPFTGRRVKHLAKSLGRGKWLVDRRALDEALKDSNKILSDARFIPYREGGVVKGFLLSQVRPYGIFYEMGIRSGDIILRVNDYAVDAPEKVMSLMQGLKGETDVKVDLLRRGRAKTFNYEIR